MKIAICASLSFTNEIKEIKESLLELGHEVFMPQASDMIYNGELSLEQIEKEKETGAIVGRAIKQNAIKAHYEKIKNSDAILICNYNKKEIENYIGGNTLMEMEFAYVNNKKIFLLNEIPEIGYKDEILEMEPIVINGDLSKIG